MTVFQNRLVIVAVQLKTAKRAVLQIKSIPWFFSALSPPRGLKAGEARLAGRSCIFL